MAISRSILAGLALVLGAASPLRAADAGAFMQQGATIVGTVTSEGGSPLAYATVSLPRLNLSATTDASGNYRLTVAGDRLVPGPDTLVVERLGYATTRVPVTLRAGDQRVDVQVASSALPLDEIVVTGTVGNQQRRAQPAVVATINAADIVDKAPVTGVTELLAGRTPGVSIVQASGTTGAASRINIRGQGSINLSNRPLVFIDGVRISSASRDAASNVGGQRIDGLSDLNPEDIESIEVVKGPAAATLYGADATAGVIQIITKRGRAGGHSFVQNLTTEYNHIDPNFTPATNYYRCTANDVAATSSVFLCQGRAAGDVVTDNPLERQDAFNSGDSKILRYTARGGGNDFGYFVSLATDDETGTLRGNTLERRTGRVNFNWNPHPKVIAEAGIGLTRSEVALPMGDQSGQGYLIGSGFGTPRTVRQLPDGSITGGWLNANESVESISSIENANEATRVTPTATVRYQPIPWFTNQFTVGAVVPEPYRALGDPRVPFTSAGTKAQDGILDLFRQNKFTGYASPVRLTSGLEARYILAEARLLGSSDPAPALALIDERRAAGSQPDFAGGSTAEILAELMDQRARDFWLEAKHLGDWRRNPEATPYIAPAGAEHYKAGVFGNATCVPVPDSERNANPNFPKS